MERIYRLCFPCVPHLIAEVREQECFIMIVMIKMVTLELMTSQGLIELPFLHHILPLSHHIFLTFYDTLYFLN